MMFTHCSSEAALLEVHASCMSRFTERGVSSLAFLKHLAHIVLERKSLSALSNASLSSSSERLK